MNINSTITLLDAAALGQYQKVYALLRSGADPNVANRDSMVTNSVFPMSAASEKGHLDIVNLLLDSGATDGYQALFEAAYAGHFEIFKHLVWYVDQSDNTDDSNTLEIALHHSQSRSILEYLLCFDFAVNAAEVLSEWPESADLFAKFGKLPVAN